MNDSYAPVLLAYIDPGTGSMLFTVLLGLFSVLFYTAKGLFLKIKYSVGIDKSNHDTNNYVIYTDSKRYWNTFKPVCDEFEKKQIELLYYTQSQDDPVFDIDYKYIKPSFIGEGNKAFSVLNFLKANILLSTTPSLDVYQWKRSKETMYYIHIPHMCSNISLYRMFGVDYYDAVLVSNQLQLEEVRQLELIKKIPEKEIRIVGLTYFDEMNKRLSKTEKSYNTVPIVLLAPSWGGNSLLNKYGCTLIDELLKTNYQIIIRPHPQSFISETNMLNDLMKKYPEIEWNTDNDNFDVLNKADILISDFSGVVFDFAIVFDKPIIYTETEFDYSQYDAYWLNEDAWTFELFSRLGKELNYDNICRIKEIIDDSLNNAKYSEERRKIKDEVWFNKGNAAKTIVDFMVEKNSLIVNRQSNNLN